MGDRTTGTTEPGVIYLLHFETPLSHARHYLGWTASRDTLRARLCQHMGGTGSRLVAAVVRSGIRWYCVRVWVGDRHMERRLKKRHNTPKLCPVCQEELDLADLMAGPASEKSLRELTL